MFVMGINNLHSTMFLSGSRDQTHISLTNQVKCKILCSQLLTLICLIQSDIIIPGDSLHTHLVSGESQSI